MAKKIKLLQTHNNFICIDQLLAFGNFSSDVENEDLILVSCNNFVSSISSNLYELEPFAVVDSILSF